MHKENPEGKLKQRCTGDKTCIICLKITAVKYLAFRFFFITLIKYFPCLSYTRHAEFSLRTLAELWGHGNGFLSGDKSILQGLD